MEANVYSSIAMYNWKCNHKTEGTVGHVEASTACYYHFPKYKVQAVVQAGGEVLF